MMCWTRDTHLAKFTCYTPSLSLFLFSPPTDVKRRVTHKQMSERPRALPHQLEEPPIELLPTPSLQMADVGREPGVGASIFLCPVIAEALIQKQIKSFSCHLTVPSDLWGYISLLLPVIFSPFSRSFPPPFSFSSLPRTQHFFFFFFLIKTCII